MYGPVTPSGSSGSDAIIMNQDEGGRFHKPKEISKQQLRTNNEAIIIAISEFILNRN